MIDMEKLFTMKLTDVTFESIVSTEVFVFRMLDKYVLIAKDLYIYQYTDNISEVISILEEYLLTINKYGADVRLIDYSSRYKFFSLTKEDMDSIVYLELSSNYPPELEDWLKVLNIVNGKISKEVYYA